MVNAPTVHTAPRYHFAPNHQSTANGTMPVSVPIGVSVGAPSVVGVVDANYGCSGQSVLKSSSYHGAAQYNDSSLSSSSHSAAHHHHHRFLSRSSGPLRTVPSLVRAPAPPLITMQSHGGQCRGHQRHQNHLEIGAPSILQDGSKKKRALPVPSKLDVRHYPLYEAANGSNPNHIPMLNGSPPAPIHHRHALSSLPEHRYRSMVQDAAKANDERAPPHRMGSGPNLKSVAVGVPRLVSQRSISHHDVSRYAATSRGSSIGSSISVQGRVRVLGQGQCSSSGAVPVAAPHPHPVRGRAQRVKSFPLGDSSVDRYIGIKRIGAGTFADIWEVYDRVDPQRKHWALKVLKAAKYRTSGSGGVGGSSCFGQRGGMGIGQQLQQQTTSAVDHCKLAKYESAMISEGNRIRKLNEKDRSGNIPIVRCKEVLVAGAHRNGNGNGNGNEDRHQICNQNGSHSHSHSHSVPLQRPCIVLELMGISLLQYIQICSSKNLVIGLRTVRAIAVQLFSAMSFLHGKGGYIHADLKPENVLITLEDSINGNLWTNIHPKIKVVDLGNALSYHRNINTFEVQSLYYRAPEVLFGNEISAAIDMWSIGCILVELININEFNRSRCRSRSSTSSNRCHQNHSARTPTASTNHHFAENEKRSIQKLAEYQPNEQQTGRRTDDSMAVSGIGPTSTSNLKRNLEPNSKSKMEITSRSNAKLQIGERQLTTASVSASASASGSGPIPGHTLQPQAQHGHDQLQAVDDEMVSVPAPAPAPSTSELQLNRNGQRQRQREGASIRQRRPMRRAHHALLACRSTVGLAQKIHSVLCQFPGFVYNPFYSFHYEQMAAAFVPPRVMTEFNASYQEMKAARKRKLCDRLSIETNETTTEYQQFIDLIAGLLDLDPATRFTSEDAIQHRFCIDAQYLEPPIISLLSTVYDSAYPIISISDDEERQKRIDLQVQQYQMIRHRVQQQQHPQPPRPKERAITTKNSAFNAAAFGSISPSNRASPKHNRAICAVNGCCQSNGGRNAHGADRGERIDHEHRQNTPGQQPPVKKMKLIL